MSQFILTPEEDAIMLSALRAKAASYLAMYGVFDSELEALIDKVESQLATSTVQETVVSVEETPAPKAKKVKDE